MTHNNQIVFVTSNFPPVSGGISHYLYEITRHLQPEQVQVIGLPTPGWEIFDSQQPFPISRLRLPAHWDASSAQFKFLAPFYFGSLLSERQAGIILCGQAHHTFMLPAWLVHQAKGTPYGVFVFGLDILRPQTRRYRALFNYLLRQANVVFAISQQTADMAKQIGVHSNRIQVIYPSVDIKKISNQQSPDKILNRHHLTGKRVILSLGQLVERKGVDTVIKAMPLVLEKLSDAHYLVVGSGKYESNLKELVHELGLQEHVTFAGHVLDEEVGDYYAACDVFAMISRELIDKGDVEGFGIVFLEANLLSKPVIGGRSGGVVDAVLDGKTGLLVDPLDPVKVAAAIIRLLSDSALSRQLGETGRARVLNEFTNTQAQQLLTVLSEMTLARQ